MGLSVIVVLDLVDDPLYLHATEKGADTGNDQREFRRASKATPN